MSPTTSIRRGTFCILLSACFCADPALAGGGYFALGYGPVARQMSGATTAVAEDAYAGASNPAKAFAAGNRVDIGLELFNPHRRIDRKGAINPVYDFSSDSDNDLFLVPEAAFSRRLGDDMAWGVTVYGNGGLNTEYTADTGVPGTNGNPTACGARPANFLLGCGKLGFDLMQLIVAPTLAWHFAPGQSLGVAPLIAMQRIDVYGLQALAPLSERPGSVTNRGNSTAFGGGVRVGWYGEITPWLNLGVAYSTRIEMQDFSKYRGLLAEGSFDVPENYSVGIALKPDGRWLLAFDIQRINFGDVNALGNGVQNSLVAPPAQPLGGDDGSGFNWRNSTTYRVGVAFKATPAVTLRAGWAHGERPNRDDIDSVSLNLMAPNAVDQASLGLTWQIAQGRQLHLGVSHFFEKTYSGPSALPIGGTETLRPYVNTFMVAWSWLL